LEKIWKYPLPFSHLLQPKKFFKVAGGVGGLASGSVVN